MSLVETAKAAEFFLSDGVILTGTATGVAADCNELKSLQENIKIPILIGSGVTLQNFEHYQYSNAVIIGSHFKKDGLWLNDVDEEVVKKFMTKIQNKQHN